MMLASPFKWRAAQNRLAYRESTLSKMSRRLGPRGAERPDQRDWATTWELCSRLALTSLSHYRLASGVESPIGSGRYQPPWLLT